MYTNTTGVMMDCNIYIQGQRIVLTPDCLLFNGYINHNGKLLYDLHASDTILSLMINHSIEEILSFINGSFWLLYYKDNTVFFTIDHFGGYSLFYKQTERGIEIFDNPMLADAPQQIDDAALCSLFASGYTQNDDTIFENIKECFPGCLYLYNTQIQKLQIKKWFSYHASNEDSSDVPKLTEIVDSLFPLLSDGKYALSLSGGIDSRFLFGCLIKRNYPFQAYSFGSILNNDKKVAREISAYYNVPFLSVDFDSDMCKNYFTNQDIEFVLTHCTQGRSLPNETDLIPSDLLNPQTDIICKGYCGDGLAGSLLSDDLRKINSLRALVDYIYTIHFNLTGISSDSYKFVIKNQLESALKTLFDHNQRDIIATYEEWHLLHKQRKYVVNSLEFYKAKGFRFYLPFYDRNLVSFFLKLRYVEKIKQKAYFEFLKNHFFKENLLQLQFFPTSRSNFIATRDKTVFDFLQHKVHNCIRQIDSRNLRKRFFHSPQTAYADVVMLYNHNLDTIPFLKNKISSNFPKISALGSQLSEAGCIESAKHVAWLARQSTAQLYTNGISISKIFFSHQFADLIHKYK